VDSFSEYDDWSSLENMMCGLGVLHEPAPPRWSRGCQSHFISQKSASYLFVYSKICSELTIET